MTGWSTIRVKHNTYSVPSRLIGESVRVHLYDDKLDVRFGGKSQLVVDRLHGRNGHHINYRHIIWSLVQKLSEGSSRIQACQIGCVVGAIDIGKIQRRWGPGPPGWESRTVARARCQT